MGEIFIGRGKRICRLLVAIFVVTSLGFVASRWINPDLGLKPIGQIRGYGFYNILSGAIFGMGIVVAGGCILGTLRNIGEGNLNFVFTLLAFIPGMALVMFVLNPLLKHGYDVKKVGVPDLLGCQGIYVTLFLVALAITWSHLYLKPSPPKRQGD